MSKSILTACVQRLKASGLKGKGRDDAAGHFIAGAKAALDATREVVSDGNEVSVLEVPDDAKYVEVIEALALAAGD